MRSDQLQCMMLLVKSKTLELRTDKQSQFVDITLPVGKVVEASNVNSGFVIVYVPHTTAGVTINENADPDVVDDMLEQLEQIVPWRQPFYQHAEGNSASHVKATMTGSSVTVLIQNAKLVLGTWQGIYFCEFDGPRSRKFIVAVSDG